MILLPLQLPLLIKEKVECYYYFDKWKDSIKIMNQEYRKQVSIDEIGTYTILIEWKNKHPYCRREYTNTILHIVGGSHRRGCNIKEFYDRKKRYVGYPIAQLPPKYHYSSGLNDPTGYK